MVSKATINGVSLSEAKDEDFIAALRRDGWQTESGPGRGLFGHYEHLNFWACKGTAAACASSPRVTFDLTVVRRMRPPPATLHGEDVTTATEYAQSLRIDPKFSHYYDEAAEVLVQGTLLVPDKLNHPEIQQAIDRMIVRPK